MRPLQVLLDLGAVGVGIASAINQDAAPNDHVVGTVNLGKVVGVLTRVCSYLTAFGSKFANSVRGSGGKGDGAFRIDTKEAMPKSGHCNEEGILDGSGVV